MTDVQRQSAGGSEDPAQGPGNEDVLPASPAARSSPAAERPPRVDELAPYSARYPRCPRLDHVPQLSIRYLLLWTATTAVALLVFNWLGMEGAKLGALAGLIIVALAIVVGWIWMALCIVGWHGARKSLWRLEPGECLLLGPGGLASSAILMALILSKDNRSASVLTVFLILATGWAFYLVRTSDFGHSSAWTLIHFANGLAVFSPVFLIVWPVALIVWVLLPPVVLVTLIAAIVDDRRHQAPRHWLHWSGVALYSLVPLGLLGVEIFLLGLLIRIW